MRLALSVEKGHFVPVDSKPRIAGWLLVPLAWLIIALLASALVMTMYIGALAGPAIEIYPGTPRSLRCCSGGVFAHVRDHAGLYGVDNLAFLPALKASAAALSHLAVAECRPGAEGLCLLSGGRSAGDAQFAVRAAGRQRSGAYFKRSQRVKNTFVAP